MRTSTSLTKIALGAALLLAASACSSSQNASGGDAGADTGTPVDAYVAPLFDAEVCNNNGGEVDTYYPGITKAGSMGSFSFVLTSADPTPPSDPGLNTWKVKVVDSTGATVKGATLSLPTSSTALGWPFAQNPWMPVMRHGGTIPSQVTNNGDGTAAVVVDFNMNDYWQTRICAQSGSTTDCATFSFCLP